MGKKTHLTVEDSKGGGIIAGGYASNCAGGIHCEAGCRLYLKGGSVTGNQSSWGGGGVYLDSSAYLYLYDGASIYGNWAVTWGESSAKHGGGVYADRDSRIYMYGGTIAENSARSSSSVDGRKGGGIYAYRAVCYIYGGKIYRNQSCYGGGIYLEKCGSAVSSEYGLFMNGDINMYYNGAYGEYSGQWETEQLGKGGGIYVDGKSDLSLTGNVNVHDNRAGVAGGGVYLEAGSNSKLTVGGTPQVQNNILYNSAAHPSGATSNLEPSSAAALHITGAKDLVDGACIGMSSQTSNFTRVMYDYEYGDTSDTNTGADAKTAAFPTRYFPSDDPSWHFVTLADRDFDYETGSTSWSEGNVYHVKDGTEAGDPFVTGLTFKDADGNAVKSQVSIKNNAISVVVPYGTDLTKLAPEFTYQAAALRFVGDNGYIGQFNNGSDTFDFTNGRRFLVSQYSYYDDTTIYRTVYNISVSCSEAPKNDVTVTGDHCTVEGSATDVAQDTQVSVKYTGADEGYRFDHWEVVSGSLTLTDEQAKSEELTFTMPGTAVQLRAVTSKISYRLDFMAGNELRAMTRTVGETVTLSVPASTGYTPKWTQKQSGDPVDWTISDDKLSVTFTMPAYDVYVVEANELSTCDVSLSDAQVTREITPRGYTRYVYKTGALTYEVTYKLRIEPLAPWGKQFKQWKITEDGAVRYETGEPLDYAVGLTSKKVTIEAEFEDVTKSDVDVINGEGSGQYEQGDTVTITANEILGERFVCWKVLEGGAVLADASAAQTTFTMPGNAVKVQATFETLEQPYVLTLDGCTAAKAGGGAAVSSGDSVDAGTSLTFTHDAAAEGHSFDHWELTWEGYDGTYTSYDDVLSADMPHAAMTAKAVYRVNSYYLDVTGATGTQTGYYEYGADVSLEADAAAEGYEFDAWKATGISLTDEQARGTSLSFAMPASDVTLRPTYKAIDYTLTVEGGTIAASGQSTATFHKDDVVALVPNAVAGKTFAGWEVTQGAATMVTGEGYRFQLEAGDCTIKATYADNTHAVSATVSPESAKGCSVSGVGTYTVGDTVTLAAVAGDEYAFGSWSGLPAGATTDGNIATFTMPDEDVSVTASFAKVKKYAVTLNDTAYASYAPGEKVAVDVAAENFKGWSGYDGLSDWSSTTEAGKAVAAFTMPERDVALTATHWNNVDSIEISMADVKDPTSAVSVSSNDGEDADRADKYVLASVATWESTGMGGTTSITFTAQVNSDAWPDLRFGQSLSATVNGTRATVTLADSGSSVATVTVEFMNDNPRLQSVEVPEVPEVENGTTLETMVERGILPAFAMLVTDDGDFQSIIDWDLSSASPSYDPTSTKQQVFTISGTFVLPSGIDNPDGISTTVTAQVTVLAAPGPEKHAVTVAGGIIAKEDGVDVSAQVKTSGDYAAGTTLVLRPNVAPAGQEFSQWKITAGGETYHSGTEELEFEVPALDVAFEAEYVDAPVGEHSVDVRGGSGSGSYAEGKTVAIEANDLPGYSFVKWECVSGSVTFGDAASKATTFTMPSNDVVVKATYVEVEKRSVTVNGEDWGSYVAGSTVTVRISAENFKEWGGQGAVADWQATEQGEWVVATFTMPDKDVALTASYWRLVSSLAITMADLGDAQSAVSVLANGGEDADKEHPYTVAAVESYTTTGTETTVTFDVRVNSEWWGDLRLGQDLTATVNGRVATVTLADSGSQVATVLYTFTNVGPVPPVVEQHTLTFQVNGGTAVDAVVADTGTTVDLSRYSTARDGYTFAGWFGDEGLTQQVTSVTLDADTTVYAKWEKKADPGSSSGSGSSPVVASGAAGGGSATTPATSDPLAPMAALCALAAAACALNVSFERHIRRRMP